MNSPTPSASTFPSRLKRFVPHLRSWLWTLFWLLIVVFAFNQWRTRDVPTEAPQFSAPMLDETRFDLVTWRAEHNAQPVALIFWAQWCPICRTEEHSINRLLADYPQTVFVVATQSGDAAQIRHTLSERGHDNWRVIIDEQGELMHAFGFSAVPAFVIVDRDGRLRHTQVGYTSEIGMRARLWLSR